LYCTLNRLYTFRDTTYTKVTADSNEYKETISIGIRRAILRDQSVSNDRQPTTTIDDDDRR